MGTVANGTNYFTGFSHDNSTARSFYNGSQTQAQNFSGAVSTSAVNLNIGRNPSQDPNRNFDGKIFFVVVASTGLSEFQHATFYTLYKQTLGAGLGLP